MLLMPAKFLSVCLLMGREDFSGCVNFDSDTAESGQRARYGTLAVGFSTPIMPLVPLIAHQPALAEEAIRPLRIAIGPIGEHATQRQVSAALVFVVVPRIT